VTPQQLLGIVDGLGDHIAVSQETCRTKTARGEEVVLGGGNDGDREKQEEKTCQLSSKALL